MNMDPHVKSLYTNFSEVLCMYIVSQPEVCNNYQNQTENILLKYFS